MANIFPVQKLKNLASQLEYAELEQKIAIVSRWLDDYNTGTLKTDKETSREQAYNQDIFIKVLGYEEKPSNPYSFEPKPSTSKGELPDAIVGHLTQSAFTFADQKVSAVVELKGTSVALDKPQKREGNMSPVQQGFKYKPKYKYCPFVIVSNFYEFRLYQDNQLDYEVWTLEDLCNPEDDYIKFKTFYFLLNKDNFVAKNGDGKSNTEELLSDIRVEQEEIGKKFYAVYKQARLELLRSMWRNNDRVKTDIEFGIEKAQKIIDRIVFACFAEDRGLLPDNTMAHVIKNSDSSFGTLWENLKGFFNAVDVGSEKLEIPHGYNGGLFAKDKELDDLIIDDEPLRSLSELSTYDFNEQLSVQILGHIFEQSISDLEEIKEKAESVVKEDISIVKKISKRKKDGIFYTPDYIVKYIVENTLGSYLRRAEDRYKNIAGLKEEINDKNYLSREKTAYKNYQSFLQGVKVCDPACGSGAFLVQVFDYLLAENKRVAEILDGDEGSLFNTEAYVKDILTNNIYGVDLNEESVEIAKLSLWLKSAEKGKPLTNLNNNIKCGNSLIDDPIVASEKAFEWKKEFSEIFSNGGFDVIVGNPPYVSSKEESFDTETKNYLNSIYTTAQYQIDTYILFIERALQLIKQGESISYIVPNAWLNNMFLTNIRKFILDTSMVNEIVIMPSNTFADATVDTVIINLSKDNSDSNEITVKKSIDNQIETLHVLPQIQFLKNEGFIFDIFNGPAVIEILHKIEVSTTRIKDIFTTGRGVGIYHKRVGHTKEFIASNPYLADTKKDETFVPYLKGRDIGRYNVNKEGYKYLSYGSWLAEPREPKFFENERLLVRKIPAKNTLVCAYLDEKFITDQSIYIALQKNNKFDIKYCLAILNSTLLGFYFKYKNSEFDDIFPQIKVDHFRELPIKNVSQIEQAYMSTKVSELLEITERINDINDKFIKLVASHLELPQWPNTLKAWWSLEFKQFIQNLRNKISLTEKQELISLFEENGLLIRQLIETKNLVNQEIENKVFELYDLTDDEIFYIKSAQV